MDIRIGITNTGRELSFESSESADSIKATVAEAITSGAPLTLTDVKGNSYIVPTANLAFVEVGSEETRRVGFVA
ncbi:DUF3107 family protein [Microbacterium sp. MEC084]|uniref:DUF3107 domain-containing protein n=1 Tax=unclassified Microbacterium TaxID=2609290 RepID=UPI0006F31ADE|nr:MULTISPECIES: DUF3107 domain-containing protein [unclassified Microbacterium]KQZ04946.1 ATP-binding protein [Microbacterium sp. Root53]MCD1267569.1 DUF3107 family protein [Microbacterium sp. MEC084]